MVELELATVLLSPNVSSTESCPAPLALVPSSGTPHDALFKCKHPHVPSNAHLQNLCQTVSVSQITDPIINTSILRQWALMNAAPGKQEQNSHRQPDMGFKLVYRTPGKGGDNFPCCRLWTESVTLTGRGDSSDEV